MAADRPMPDDPPRNPPLTVDRTHAPRPPDPVTPRVGTSFVPARPTGTAEELLRAWAKDLATAPDRSLPRRGPSWLLPGRRPLVTAGLVLLAVLAVVFGAGYLISEDIGDNVKRVPDVFGSLDPSVRPAPNRSLTFLLVGTDSRSSEPTTGSDASPGVDAGSQRSDVLMIARLNPDRTVAAVASIPRDSWVDIPGHGQDKINAAYSFGGPSLLVQTVENLTRIRIDHFAVIDFAGFRSMVDAVGGIDVGIDAPTSNDGVTFHQGVNHLDGRAALAYVRQRYGLVAGDFDRAQREQNALRALVAQVAARGTLSSPAGTYDLLDAASRSVSVDDTLSNGGLRSLASDLNGLQTTDITFVRAPVTALGRQGAQSVVYLDSGRAGELWNAIRDDRVAAYADAHPGETLGAVTR